MESNEKESGLSFERVVFFSDAVFAIVITLLVLEIKVPHVEGHTERAVLGGLLGLLPKFVGFVMSFFIVGVMWIEHHRVFRFIERYDAGLLRRNLFFLLGVSFVPFPDRALQRVLLEPRGVRPPRRDLRRRRAHEALGLELRRPPARAAASRAKKRLRPVREKLIRALPCRALTPLAIVCGSRRPSSQSSVLS